jgi:Na+-transporting NADH:ubiquinone oxidoreductase subunit D
MEWKRFGYGLILVIVSMIWELFGSGELMGYRIIPESIYKLGYFNNSLVIMPMALIIVGILIWIQRSRNQN